MKRVMFTAIYFSALFFGPSILVMLFSMFLSGMFGIPQAWTGDGTIDIRPPVSGFLTAILLFFGTSYFFIEELWNSWKE